MNYLLQLALAIVELMKQSIDQAERDRRDAVKYEVYSGMLSRLSHFLFPYVEDGKEFGQAAFLQFVAILSDYGAVVARFVGDNMADCADDRAHSQGVAVKASVRVYDSIGPVIRVTMSQRDWIRDESHFHMRDALPWSPHHPAGPDDVERRLSEFSSVIDSLNQDTERALGDLNLAHDFSQYVAPLLQGAGRVSTEITLAATHGSFAPVRRIASSDIKVMLRGYWMYLASVEKSLEGVKRALSTRDHPVGGADAATVRAQIAVIFTVCVQAQLVIKAIRATLMIIDSSDASDA